MRGGNRVLVLGINGRFLFFQLFPAPTHPSPPPPKSPAFNNLSRETLFPIHLLPFEYQMYSCHMLLMVMELTTSCVINVKRSLYICCSELKVVYICCSELKKVVYICCSELKVVYICCSELQVVYICCSELKKVVYICCSELMKVVYICCSELKKVVYICCSELKVVYICCSELKVVYICCSELKVVYICCSELKVVYICCSELKVVYICCSELKVGASGIHIPNLLKNYPMKLHEIKTVHEYFSRAYLSNFRCILIIELEVISHFPNKHNYKLNKTDVCVSKKEFLL